MKLWDKAVTRALGLLAFFLAANALAATPPAWYNVKDYGAKGDGVTDDTAAIQATLDAAMTTVANKATTYRFGKGTVYIPAGDYKITSGLKVDDVQGYHLTGEGFMTRLLVAGNVPNVLELNGVSDSTFENFTITGIGVRTDADGGEVVGRAIWLHYSETVARSTERNTFRKVVVGHGNNVSGGAYQVRFTFDIGFAVGDGDTTNADVADDFFYDCTAAGAWNMAGPSFSTHWQYGFKFGVDAAGQNVSQYVYNPRVLLCRYGFGFMGSSGAVYGAVTSFNGVDVYRSKPNGAIIVSGLRSENARFLYANRGGAAGDGFDVLKKWGLEVGVDASAGGNNSPVTLESCEFLAPQLPPVNNNNGYWIWHTGDGDLTVINASCLFPQNVTQARIRTDAGNAASMVTLIGVTSPTPREQVFECGTGARQASCIIRDYSKLANNNTIQVADVYPGTSIRSDTSRTANNFEVRNSGNAIVFSVGSDGKITGDGSGITNLNASNISSGQMPVTRLATTGAAAGQVPQFNGTNVVWTTPSGTSTGTTSPFVGLPAGIVKNNVVSGTSTLSIATSTDFLAPTGNGSSLKGIPQLGSTNTFVAPMTIAPVGAIAPALQAGSAASTYNQSGVLGLSAAGNGIQGNSSSGNGLSGSSASGRGLYVEQRNDSITTTNLPVADLQRLGSQATPITSPVLRVNDANPASTGDLVDLQVGGGNRLVVSHDGMIVSGGWLRGSSPLTFDTIPAGSTLDVQVPLAGATANDMIQVSPSGSLPGGLLWTGYVVSSGVVAIRLANISPSAITPPTLTWQVACFQTAQVSGASSSLAGDVTGDGIVDVKDAKLVLGLAGGMATVTNAKNGDIAPTVGAHTGDGVVNIVDAAALLKAIAKQ